ncbi:sensor histidine kinase [Cellulophaga baltica]|uniref:sensor histidine kinase n=1 Tax=Cellulophaga TaxID=104264 RepID=UPI00068AAABF|nr:MULTISPECIES: sensor histidine kinase [Cellulophaga]MCR1025721.1 sensor histidine kinase [Cellulophaga baltica]
MIGDFKILEKQKLRINVLIGLGLTTIPILTSPDVNLGLELFKVAPFQRNFLSYQLLTIFFFTSYYYIIPNFYFNKKWLYLVLILIVGYLLVIKFPQFLISDFSVHKSNNLNLRPLRDGVSRSTRFGSINFILSRDSHLLQFIGIFFLSLYLRVNERLTEINNEKLLTEIAYLKSQINPHFLFNTLNSLFALALTKSDKTPQAILQLSDLMRYVITQNNQQFIALDKEVGYLKSFIDLQKLRLTKKTTLRTEFRGDFENQEINPLMLICIIENAFKYGSDVENNSEIEISLVLEDNILKLNVTNTIVKSTERIKNQSTSLGLKNTKKQLELFYANKYKLNVVSNMEYFKVNLEIELK